MKKNLYDCAISDFTAALQLDPYHTDCLYNRGIALSKIGKQEHAIADLSIVLNDNPNHVSAAFTRATCFNTIGQFSEAIEDYNIALQKDQFSNSSTRSSYDTISSTRIDPLYSSSSMKSRSPRPSPRPSMHTPLPMNSSSSSDSQYSNNHPIIDASLNRVSDTPVPPPFLGSKPPSTVKRMPPAIPVPVSMGGTPVVPMAPIPTNPKNTNMRYDHFNPIFTLSISLHSLYSFALSNPYISCTLLSNHPYISVYRNKRNKRALQTASMRVAIKCDRRGTSKVQSVNTLRLLMWSRDTSKVCRGSFDLSFFIFHPSSFIHCGPQVIQ